MEFQIRRPDGSLEWRRHIPWNLVQHGACEWHAIHASNGRLLARSFISAAHLESTMSGVTEPVPHYKPR